MFLYIVARGKITAISRYYIPLDGTCAKQIQVPPDGTKLSNVTVYVELVPTDVPKKQQFAVYFHHVGF